MPASSRPVTTTRERFVEFCYRSHLLNHEIVGDARLVASKQSAGHESTGAITETDQNQKRDGQQNHAGPDQSARPFLQWRALLR